MKMFRIYIFFFLLEMSSKFDLVTELKQIIKHEASRNMNDGIEVTPLLLYDLIEYLMQNNLLLNTQIPNYMHLDYKMSELN